MNEAFSDLSVINEFSTNEDYMPFIHSLNENTIKGSLYMSIFGSGTCNSEFEYLTGNSMSFLRNGIIAYTQVVKDKLPNMTYLLKNKDIKAIWLYILTLLPAGTVCRCMIIWDLIIFIQRQILRIRQCIENIFLMNLVLRR